MHGNCMAVDSGYTIRSVGRPLFTSEFAKPLAKVLYWLEGGGEITLAAISLAAFSLAAFSHGSARLHMTF